MDNSSSVMGLSRVTRQTLRKLQSTYTCAETEHESAGIILAYQQKTSMLQRLQTSLKPIKPTGTCIRLGFNALRLLDGSTQPPALTHQASRS